MSSKIVKLVLAVISNRGARRLSAFNRLISYLGRKGTDQRVSGLHDELEKILEESHKKWPHYDYGEGYFYQSYPPLFIQGLRNTDFRFKLYKLDSILTPKMVTLDIGCNTGFLSLMIAKNCKHIDAFDNNPFLIQIAEKCRQFENTENINYCCLTFDQFNSDLKYDLVLSLANHHTFDGNMCPEFRKYIERIRQMMQKGGLLIFESHPGEFRQPFFKDQLAILNDFFNIENERVVSTVKSAFDTNRSVVWMRAT